jgi:regulator of sigma E protease
MEYFTYLYVFIAVLFLFGAAVFVHEWGHYIVARRRGLKVEAFAIGFGPKLFSWTKDGIEYSWRAIPAGGYVKLPQMVTSSALEGDTTTEPLPPASPISKILVAIAGPFMNIVFGFAIAILLYFVGLPVLVNPPVIGSVDPESAEAKLGIKEGDRIVAVDGKPVKSWQDITFRTATAAATELDVEIERDGQRKNYRLATKTSADIGLKWLNLEPREHPVVGMVQSGMPAEKAGLKAGDKFISFGGVPVHDQSHLADLIGKSEGKESELVIQRAGEPLTVRITPQYDPEVKKGRIGIQFGGGIYEVQKPGPKPWENVWGHIERTYVTLAALLNSKKTGVKPSDLSGPVGIFGMLATQVKTDWRLALNFMVLLNVNLAILNLLPIPVLDGGHIVMSIIERIRRKPVSAKFVEWTTTAFALLLISFMLYVSFFDIRRMPLFYRMFKQDVQIAPAEKAPVLKPAPEAPAK